MCKDCGCSSATHPLFAHSHDAPAAETTSFQVGNLRLRRRVNVEESVFKKNQELAQKNRSAFKTLGLTVFNVMSSPGAGKTSLLARVLPELNESHPVAVVVGDQETSIDADRLKAAGVLSVQINTHSACHLDAHRVAHAVERLPLDRLRWLVIENVGNLVCPAVFDLGEAVKVALLSTPEGEEKPLKYPVLFHDADLVVVTKSDLIPHLQYNSDLVLENIRKMNPDAPVVFCSLRTGDGLEKLSQLLEELAARKG